MFLLNDNMFSVVGIVYGVLGNDYLVHYITLRDLIQSSHFHQPVSRVSAIGGLLVAVAEQSASVDVIHIPNAGLANLNTLDRIGLALLRVELFVVDDKFIVALKSAPIVVYLLQASNYAV